MRVPYEIRIAWRYLLARGRQTVLTTTGVALGVTIVTVMQSYMGGFLDYFVQRSLQSTPSITVTQATKGLPNPAGPIQRTLAPFEQPAIGITQLPIPSEEEELQNPRQAEAIITGIPEVQAISPFINGQGIILNGNLQAPVSFIGINPLREVQVTDLNAQITAGAVADLANQEKGIILGSALADDVGAGIGDRITVISQKGISRRFLVVGISSTQLRQVDLVRAHVNLRQAQQLMQMRGLSGLGVRTAPNLAIPVARRIEARTGYVASSWQEENANILDLFTTISLIIYLVVGFTMVVAGFGIANTLILTVNEKRRDIGVLKALGVPPRSVAYVFLSIGMLVGILGVIIGLLLGAVGIAILANTPVPVQPQGRSGGLIQVGNFPVLRTPRVYLVAGLFGLLVSTLSSVLPSLRASKSDPIQVIREAE